AVDDARSGAEDAAAAAGDMAQFVADPGVTFVIGPLGSQATAAAIPIARNKGLTQCSPSATDPTLTSRWSSPIPLQVSAFPHSFVRVITRDDAQAQAAADMAYTDARARKAVIVQEDSTAGIQLGQGFVFAFDALGGKFGQRLTVSD